MDKKLEQFSSPHNEHANLGIPRTFVKQSIVDSRICEYCGIEQPLSEFRHRYQNQLERLRQCRSCHNQSERIRRAKKQVIRNQHQMEKFLSQIINERCNQRLKKLCQLMLSRCGGMHGFASTWETYFERALQKKGYAALRCFDSMFSLLQYCDENESRSSDMIEEDLKQSIKKHVMDLVGEHPELAVAAARELGWTVIPPKDQ